MGLLHFLDLPLELLLSILKRIDTLHDKLSVVFTCHKLYSALYYDVVSEQIRRGAGKDVYGLREDLLVRKPGTANSEPIRLERFRPFVFSGSSVSEDGASLMVKLIVPRFMPPDDDFHEGDIIIEKNTVYVYRNVKGSKSTDVDNTLSEVFEVQWNAHLRYGTGIAPSAMVDDTFAIVGEWPGIAIMGPLNAPLWNSRTK
ncbi:hypothetical protein AAF712_009134 [Marasmius tenuissimus]|uniref:F-box domain-containing protein n=1 Tax=Marasmius tenuissimus TaxID=585030 RepID=A0ABR2ZSD7_9AGAR